MLFFAALLLGGGGVAYGLHNLAIQLLALLILAQAREQFFSFWREAPRGLTVLVTASLAIPALQLVPLPASIWTTLAGRELAAEARQAADAMGWYALTLDRNRTLVALVGLIAPLTVLIVGWKAPLRSLTLIGWAVVAFGLAQFVIGVPQVLYSSALLYPENPMPGVLFGTFANRNTTGVFLVACLALAVSLPARDSFTANRLVRITAEVVLLLAIILTQSRTAILLTALPAGLILTRAISSVSALRARRRLLAATGLALAAIAIAGAVLASQSRLDQSFERFAQTSDARFAIWEDAAFTAQKYWPVGAGMGTYDEVAYIDESLETLTERPAGRAHNDFLEVVIEAGLPGLVLLAAWICFLGWHAFTARRSTHRWIVWGAATSSLALALQSIADYSLRTQATLCLAAFLVLLIVRSSAAEDAS